MACTTPEGTVCHGGLPGGVAVGDPAWLQCCPKHVLVSLVLSSPCSMTGFQLSVELGLGNAVIANIGHPHKVSGPACLMRFWCHFVRSTVEPRCLVSIIMSCNYPLMLAMRLINIGNAHGTGMCQQYGVHASQPYSSVGSTTALYTLMLVASRTLRSLQRRLVSLPNDPLASPLRSLEVPI